MFEVAPGAIQLLVVRLLVETRNTYLQSECSVEYVRRLYIQPLCNSVCDSDSRVRHFSICNRQEPPPRENFPSDQWSPESVKNKINSISSFDM
jgi:hypothetical protein